MMGAIASIALCTLAGVASAGTFGLWAGAGARAVAAIAGMGWLVGVAAWLGGSHGLAWPL
ncbi:hypothetical protein [Sphingomonas oryzagri]